VEAVILFKVLVGFLVILFEFLDNVRAYIREVFLDSFGNPE
jgi:hypothetical protein